ncbi:MAG: hypothetical protein IPK27_15075 [Rhodanobacteraceae bacterium]|nr:hypothetical protein [Rhodanobacteraceae bacterium]
MRKSKSSGARSNAFSIDLRADSFSPAASSTWALRRQASASLGLARVSACDRRIAVGYSPRLLATADQCGPFSISTSAPASASRLSVAGESLRFSAATSTWATARWASTVPAASNASSCASANSRWPRAIAAHASVRRAPTAWASISSQRRPTCSADG